MPKVYESRPHSKSTMTVKELRDHLTNYPDDTPVIATWEGVRAGIRKENFSIEDNDGRDDLEIWVEQYG